MGPTKARQRLSAEEYYLSHWKTNRVWKNLLERHHTLRFWSCAKRLTGSRFADVGCMRGDSTLILKGMKSGAWVGIDFSKTAVEDARRHYGHLMKFFFCESPARLASLGVKYDSVVCSEVIEHVDDPSSLITGLAAITRYVFVLSTPSKEVNDPGHARLYTEKSLSELIAPYRHAVVKEGNFLYAKVEISKA